MLGGQNRVKFWLACLAVREQTLRVYLLIFFGVKGKILLNLVDIT